jgi:hypothetical protein
MTATKLPSVPHQQGSFLFGSLAGEDTDMGGGVARCVPPSLPAFLNWSRTSRTCSFRALALGQMMDLGRKLVIAPSDFISYLFVTL